jgi:ABC-type transport system involved in cytochrome c biogenesis permease component
MLTWILARKDLRRLLRDRRAMIILLAMPIIFVLVLGLSLGETFGQKPDDRLRVSVVDEDVGFAPRAVAALAVSPQGPLPGALPWGALYLNSRHQAPPRPFESKTWSKVVLHDLAETADIRVEIIDSKAEAYQLVHDSKRAAVLVFGPQFSQRVAQTSFLADGINPFYRDGVKLPEVDVEVRYDPTQRTAAAIIEQVCQVTLLRVILPWMIGRAFEKLGERDFIEKLANKVPGFNFVPASVKPFLGSGVQKAIQDFFPNYKLTGKTWADLTKAEVRDGGAADVTTYAPEGMGLLKRGALRYQILVPSYIVMFAFFMVLTVGWLFVAERQQGTLKRLRAAPLSRTEIVLGKLLPCFALSLFQGLFLLAAGKLVFGMNWGTHPVWLLLVVTTTSLAAMGMALLVAALARTETQVAIYGTLLVLVLAGISGCLLGDREMMPEAMQQFSQITPHAWALTAYKQLLTNPAPDLARVAKSCGILSLFGAGFIGLAWTFLKLD